MAVDIQKRTTKLLKSKTKKVYKNKKLNSANFGTYNLNDYQVFLQIISKIGGVDELGKYLQPEGLSREYTITSKEFEELYNIKNGYMVLKRAGTKLMQSFITLEKPELFETWQVSLCETAKYNHARGSLTIKLTESIMPYLAQVKSKFVLYNLKEVANFGSLYTTRLYELLQEFKDTGILIKSISQLREIFAVGKKFKLYADFKRKTFGHAVEEINSQYDMKLTFREIKEGRKVVAVEFSFKSTKVVNAVNQLTGEPKNIYIKPKKKAIVKEIKECPTVHPDQQELPFIKEKLATNEIQEVKELKNPEPEKIEKVETENGGFFKKLIKKYL